MTPVSTAKPEKRTAIAAPAAFATPAMPLIPNPALLDDLLDSLLVEEQIARVAKATGQVPGPCTGLACLDEELGSFLAPGVHTLLAAPGAGKTALALQIAANCGCPALYISAEMRRVELLRRIISRTTSTYLGKLRGGGLDQEALRKLARQAARDVPRLALFDAIEAARESNGSGASVAAIAERAAALRDRFQSPHVLIVIDSATEWAPLAMLGDRDAAGLTDFAQAEAALNGLRDLTSVLNCPIIAIAHRHRAGQGKEADRLHSAKGTGRYEYISESVWDLDRDTRKEPDEDGRTNATLTILKNRHGATGVSLPLRFEGRLQKFWSG